MLFYAIAIIVVLADQISKILIRLYINIGDDFLLWGVRLTHYENSGMAGSSFQGYGRLFGVIAVLFVIGVLYYRRKGELGGAILSSSMGFLVGGAIGNGIDRLLFGQVTDFIIRAGGILNFADHAIEIGVVLLICHGAVQFGRRIFARLRV
ncbi:signal peptidase II [Cohnella abietis]|uniref:Lipoprotein signal peptidase n=1 Tax=Cohnella abietis TaxID=2507935 RepID=A0A3T1DBG9_9BACL|nr:signal peptidase II [Cohnella abietis]BBI35439.1 lipoprotein signal peptidase [Cohnella abietis]